MARVCIVTSPFFLFFSCLTFSLGFPLPLRSHRELVKAGFPFPPPCSWLSPLFHRKYSSKVLVPPARRRSSSALGRQSDFFPSRSLRGFPIFFPRLLSGLCKLTRLPALNDAFLPLVLIPPYLQSLMVAYDNNASGPTLLLSSTFLVTSPWRSLSPAFLDFFVLHPLPVRRHSTPTLPGFCAGTAYHAPYEKRFTSFPLSVHSTLSQR